MALAIQALGWVKNIEVLERLKKSDDLLEILSNSAKSGETDLIRWSAAKSIISINFDFIAVSQHLNEMPKNIIRKMCEKHSEKNFIEKDTTNFWIYIDTTYFRSVTNNISILKIKEILAKKGIRGIKEVNSIFKEFFKNGISSEIFNIIKAGQQISADKLSNSSNKYFKKKFR